MSEQRKADAPLVSVILPCYNAQDYVGAALESMLRQDYRNLEIIVIDDHSTDQTPSIVRDYAGRDERIKALTSPRNTKLAKILNRGIEEARGEYIARMDADDVARPERISRQVAWLASRPEIDIVGSRINIIDERGKIRFPAHYAPTAPPACAFMTCFTAPVAHPTVLARARVFKENPYSTQPEHAYVEDLELWQRLIRQGYQFANLPEILLDYRRHAGSVSAGKTLRNKESAVSLSAAFLREHLDLSYPVEELMCMDNVGQFTQDLRSLAWIISVLENIKDRFLSRWKADRKARREIDRFIAVKLTEITIRRWQATTDRYGAKDRLRDLVSLATYSHHCWQYLGKRLYYFLL